MSFYFRMNSIVFHTTADGITFTGELMVSTEELWFDVHSAREDETGRLAHSLQEVNSWGFAYCAEKLAQEVAKEQGADLNKVFANLRRSEREFFNS